MDTRIKIKKGDLVEMRSGKDKKRRGKVLRVLPEERRVVVEGLNLVRKHVRPKKAGQKGEIVQAPRAVNIAKVMLVCVKCGQPTRISTKVVGGSKARMCKKCGSET